MRRKKVTIKDIADQAGVSIGTVSRVFNEFENVRPEVKALVLKTADEMNYSYAIKNRNGKERARSRKVGIIVEDYLGTPNAWTHLVLFNLVKALGNYDFQPIIEFWHEEKGEIPHCIQNVNSVVVWGSFTKEFYRNIKVKGKNLPIVSYSRTVPYDNSISLICRNKESVHQVVEHLLANGHNDIGLILSGGTRTTKERLEGFTESMKDYGKQVNPAWIININAHEEYKTSSNLHAGYLVTKELIAQDKRPSAIIYDSDLIAYGGIEAIKESGMKIPEDISIVGFDNLPLSKETFPPLSSMELNMDELSGLVAQSLEKLIFCREHEKVTYISRKLIRRQTIKPAISS